MANRACSGASDIENEAEAEMRKGPWTVEEDMQLMRYIRLHGEGRWNFLAKAAGLKRNGRSCRLRWVNSLRPDLKRSKITPEEERLIIELHGRWGNRWSHIARSLPGRTDNEIKNYWRTKIKGKLNLPDECSSTGVDVDNQIRYEGPLLSDCLATSSPRPTDHDSAEPSTGFPTQSTGEVEVQIDKTQYLQHNISSQVIPIHEVNDEYVLQGGTRLVPSPTDDDGHPGAASQPDFEDSENQVFENSLRYNLSAGSLAGMLYFSEFCADGAAQGDRTPPSCYTVASPEAFSDSEAYFNRYSDVLWNMDEDSGTRIGRRSY